VVTFALSQRKQLGETAFGLPVAGFVPLLALIPVIFSYVLYETTVRLDNLCFRRIHEIEKELGIKGHRYVYEAVSNTSWYRIRRWTWPVFFWTLIIIYIYTSYWLFIR